MAFFSPSATSSAMQINLRDYQSEMICNARVAMREHKSILLVSPTGSGKTTLASHMLGSAAERNKRSWFTVPKVELVRQTIEAFERYDIPHGVIASGFRPQPYENVQICSIDTLKNRLGRYQPPELIVWDEAHHTMAAGWLRVKSAYPDAYNVGLTATPERLDGKGLGSEFTAIVEGRSMSWLIDKGYLCRYKAYAPSAPDMNGVHSRMGDYVTAETAAVMDKPTITGDAISHYLRLARGKRAVAFCVSIAHSQHVEQQFRASGIVAVHLDGNTQSSDREAAMRAFKNGQIEVLTNCGLFAEGVDVPALEAAILLRPTQSLSMYLQMVGRSLRPCDGKEHAIILDHAGLIAKHGLPDDDRTWSLEGRKKNKASDAERQVAVRQCPNCYACHKPAPKCPECGHVYKIQSRSPDEVDGELVEVDVDAMRLRRKIENRSCDSLASLINLGEQRKYKRPVFWAAHYHRARKGYSATLGELISYASSIGKQDPTKWAAHVLTAIGR